MWIVAYRLSYHRSYTLFICLHSSFFKERKMIYIILNLFAKGIRMQEIQCTLFDDLFSNTRFTCMLDGLAYIKCSYTCLYFECTCSKYHNSETKIRIVTAVQKFITNFCVQTVYLNTRMGNKIRSNYKLSMQTYM